MYFWFFIFLFLCSDGTHNRTLPGDGIWSPGLFVCAQPALAFEPDPFPGLPGPAVASGGPKIDKQKRGRIYKFYLPSGLPISSFIGDVQRQDPVSAGEGQQQGILWKVLLAANRRVGARQTAEGISKRH